MLSGNLQSAKLPYNTKISLQALLKSRKELLHIRGNFPEKSNEKQLMRNLLNVAEKNIVNFESCKETSEEISDIDQNGDFTYSQKLFHIADGNLYSIFSPLQGRSYGMKPSFLRKQKCTIQECRGRGRKVLRKGLKFHNFLPSESVTSEKGSSTSVDEQWKVHSECKLKEEHGTKQIMVSNWFHNVKHSSNNVQESASSEETFTSNDANAESLESTFSGSQEDKILNGTHDFDISTDSLPVSNNGVKYSDALVVKNPPKLLKSEKHNFLNNLLLTVSNSHISHSSSPGTNFHKQIIVCEGQKHRRKPEQTRRIVPYTKYLSLMEETETGPLDLSLHSNHNTQASSVTCSENLIKSNHIYTKSDEKLHSVPVVDNKVTEYTSNKSHVHRKVKNSHNVDASNVQLKSIIQPCYSNASSFTFPTYENSLSTCSPTSANETIANSSKNYFISSALTQCSPSLESRNTPILSHVVSSHQNPCAKYCEASKFDLNAKPRKKSQRSVIKQKLEDTFKQNGFLVKTKQVSDGEATFCKFRQLRKYTRYYLKSWQQHLPDEVHKMWKGFLPPKTVLPPISGTITSSSETT